MNTTFFSRFAKWIVTAVVMLTPVVFHGVQGALQSSSNDIRQWLPAGFKETRQYDWFLANFGSEEIAVLSWPGATLDDPRVQQVADGLRRWTDAEATLNIQETVDIRPVANIEGSAGLAAGPTTPLFSRVLTGRDAVDELMSEPLNLSQVEAARRLNGTLVGPDGKTAGLVVMVNEAGAADRHRAVDVIHAVALEAGGLTQSELRMGGPTIDSVALDNESQRLRYVLAAGSVMLALLLAWRCLGQLKLVVMVFASALFSTASAVAVVYYTGGTMSMVLVTMPTMVFVLAISGAIHLTHYYRKAVVNSGVDVAPVRMVEAAWLPCGLTASTTAVGLASLMVSEVIPVKEFGMYSSIGVLLSLPVLFLFLPSLLQLCPVRPSRKFVRDAALAEQQKLAGEEIGHGWSGALASFVMRRHAWITAAGLAAMMFAAVGLFRLETTVKLISMFSPESRILQDYAWLEGNLGPLVPMEVVLKFDEQNEMPLLDRLALVSRVKEQMAAMEMVGGTMSAATFTPVMPQEGGISGIIRKRVIERRLAAALDEATADPYVRSTHEGQLWRISARVEALNSLDYGFFTESLRSQVEPLLVAVDGSTTPIQATYTGVVPLVYKAQRALLNDLTSSFLTAFLIIGVVMIVALRSLSSGLVSMLPNVFPALILFGAMGWSGRLLDIGSMMTASVALGIAVDDTIHFLTWFRRGLKQGMSRRNAIAYAYDHCAKAMLQTTIICGLGMLVFAFSSFVPTSRFAGMMFMMLVTALVGDLLFLPSLLAGPLGSFFEADGRVTRFVTRRRARRHELAPMAEPATVTA